MKCLVLGGAGFIGSHVCDALLAEGQEVIVYDRCGTNLDNLTSHKNNIDIVEGNFSCEESFDSVVSGIDYVFHLVSTTLPSNNDAYLDIETNILPTIRLLNACKRAGVKKVIYFSSGGTIYGIPQSTPLAEDHPTNPICPYGIHKLAAEKLLHYYRHCHGLDYGILRIANPFGPRQAPFGTQGAVAVFMAKALLGEPIEIWGDGSVVRDFLYVTDVAKAAVLLTRYSGNYKTFNIGSGQGISLREMISAIELTLGQELSKSFKAGRAQDVPVNVLDITLAREELGWEPAVTFSQGLEKLKASWCSTHEKFCLSMEEM